MYYIKHTDGNNYYLTATICWNDYPGWTWCVDDKTGPWLGPELIPTNYRGGRVSWAGYLGGMNGAMKFAKDHGAVVVEIADFEEGWDDH
jgi:hypothetical protein